MKDEEILRLYRKRDEQAIAETQKRYGALCYTIACNVLRDRGNAEECVNDTWRRAWDRIPPDEPQSMAAYLGRVHGYLENATLLLSTEGGAWHQPGSAGVEFRDDYATFWNADRTPYDESLSLEENLRNSWVMREG